LGEIGNGQKQSTLPDKKTQTITQTVYFTKSLETYIFFKNASVSKALKGKRFYCTQAY